MRPVSNVQWVIIINPGKNVDCEKVDYVLKD